MSFGVGSELMKKLLRYDTRQLFELLNNPVSSADFQLLRLFTFTTQGGDMVISHRRVIKK